MPSGIYIPNPSQKPTDDEVRAAQAARRAPRLTLFPRFDRHLRPSGRKA